MPATAASGPTVHHHGTRVVTWRRENVQPTTATGNSTSAMPSVHGTYSPVASTASAHPAKAPNPTALRARPARPATTNAAAAAAAAPMVIPPAGIDHHTTAGDRAIAAPASTPRPTRRVSAITSQ